MHVHRLEVSTNVATEKRGEEEEEVNNNSKNDMMMKKGMEKNRKQEKGKRRWDEKKWVEKKMKFKLMFTDSQVEEYNNCRLCLIPGVSLRHPASKQARMHCLKWNEWISIK